MKNYCFILFTFIVFLILPQNINAQQPSGGASFSVTNPDDNDYRILISFSYNGNYCNCGTQNTNIKVKIGDAFFGTPFSEHNNITYIGVPFTVGPGFNENMSALFTMTGRRTWLGTSSGTFCVHTICGGVTDNACDCGDFFGTLQFNISTAALKNPVNATVSTGAFADKIVLTWGKGTDFPNSQHDYKIYRDGDLVNEIGTVSGSGPYVFEDVGLMQGANHEYTIKTHISGFGDQESSGVVLNGSTFSLEASDGEFVNRTRVKWSNVPATTEDIRIERTTHDAMGIVTGREELAILNPSATTYNDQDGIPGFVYRYIILPLDGDANPLIEYSDFGYSKPNGSIKGHVKSALGAGVLGVDIEVVLVELAPNGGAPLPTNCPPSTTYCTTTDVEGYYELKDLYYHTGATFAIIPSKAGIIPHVFTPDTAKRSLDQIVKSVSGVDFIDETVFTVEGKVSYPPSSTACGVAAAKVLINGEDFGIKTKPDGTWAFAISDEGLYTFEVEFLHHIFHNITGDTITTILVNTDIDNINFEDITTDDLRIVVQGGCQSSLGDSVKVHIFATGCFDKYYTLDENGFLLVEDLPARKYSVQVDSIFDDNNPNLSNIMAQIGDAITIDLTVRDTAEMYMELDSLIITKADTLNLPNQPPIITPESSVTDTYIDTTRGEVFPEARFVYRSPLQITIDFEEAGATIPVNCSNIILMEQGIDYPVQIQVKESLGDCFVDQGFLIIYDNIGDRGNNFVRVPIIGGIATYTITAGEPEINVSATHNHEKYLYVIPEVDMAPSQGVEFWTFVTGVKSNAPSFVTRSPEIPMIILHDPPGDNSYAYLEEGESFKNFFRNEVLVGGDAGFYADLLIGAKVITPFSANGFGSTFKFSVSAGRDNFDRNGIETTITTTKRFQTSDLDNLTGPTGDVYVGAAFNQGFSLSESLTFDTCVATVAIVPAISVESFATTFVYTENHIKNTLLPTFGVLIEKLLAKIPQIPADTVEANQLRADSLAWETILKQNDLHRDSLAVFDENISFNAGAIYSDERTIDTTTSTSLEYHQFINTDFAHGAKIDNQFGAWFDSELGVMGAFRASVNVDSGNDTSKTTSVGYVLDDGDIGDFFSVDILEDTAYNVPAFRIKLGTSSCPHEAGTQSRDKVKIDVRPPRLDNIPADGVATFIAKLTNLSESQETREYHARVVSTTNPDGAQLTLGGRQINNGPASFFLEYNQSLEVSLEVKRGPVASNYTDIGVMFYPPCEYELWQDNGILKNVDTAFITINFQSECTNVSLINPGNNWLVNQSSNDILNATFSGYDINNPYLKSLHLDIKKDGEGYIELVKVDSVDLLTPFHDVYPSVSGLEDGAYTLRARAECRGSIGKTYSSEYHGFIDRNSLAPFGRPTPSDGFLQVGEAIGVTYDKDIDCPISYPVEISLIRDDTDAAIPFTVQCSGMEIILMPDVPLTDDPSLDGVQVTARVHKLRGDLDGNVQKYPVTWSFLVNVRPVFWDPEQVYGSTLVGQEATIQGVLKNNSLISKLFTLEKTDAPGIVDYPDWLTPTQTRGTVLANNDYTVNFAVDPTLSPGIYSGTVTAVVGSDAISMQVTFEVLAKPVNWSFDPNKYENDMTIVAQFSTTQADAPLSVDERDLIAAFVNGEIRGIANIEFIPELGNYAAYLNVYSDDDGGNNAEEISFRFWRALTGVEYSAIEKVDFDIDGTSGTAVSPLILHPEGIFQVIPLKQGWNWISLNKQNADMTREKVFQSLIYPASTNTITIKIQGSTTAYNPGSGWLGNLKVLKLGPGYLLHLSDHSDTLRVSGTAPTTPISLDISNTWNWIGYPEQSERLVDSVLSTITSSAGDQIKSQHSFAHYEASILSWVGNLTEFTPGQGYKLLSSNNGTIQFRGPEEYYVEPGGFEFNMNVNASLDPGIFPQVKREDLVVGAFVEGICRGVAEFEYSQILGEYRALILVLGNRESRDSPIEFRLLDPLSGKELIANGSPLEFKPDNIEGTMLDPYVLIDMNQPIQNGADEYSLEQSIPNPTSGQTLIPFRTPESVNVQIDLYDINGRFQRKILDEVSVTGRQMASIKLGDLPTGIYYYIMRTKEFSATKKLIIK